MREVATNSPDEGGRRNEEFNGLLHPADLSKRLRPGPKPVLAPPSRRFSGGGRLAASGSPWGARLSCLEEREN